MRKIQLISAPVDKGKLPLYEDGVFAPLGLIWLASYLNFYDYDVEILDGQHQSPEEIKNKINAPVVGITFNIFSTDSLDSIAEKAKRKGCVVVVGGQAATPLARKLLINKNIDYVVRFDGEEALKKIVDGADPSEIKGLVYRKGSVIIENPEKLLNLEKLPPINWDIPGMNIHKYWDRFKDIKRTVFHRHYHSRPLSSFAQKGCPMRVGKGGCSFCSRVDRIMRSKSPRQIYDEYVHLTSLGADRIEEFSDSFLHDKKWLSELADLVRRNGHWGIPVRVYGDTRHVDKEIIELMKIIKIDSVILGVESGNEEILKKNFKPNTMERILRSVELLGRAKIMCCPSFVLGLIGETAETVEDTFRIVEKIRERCTIEMAYFSIMTPFPASKAWDMLLEFPEMMEKYGNTYKLDQPELQKDFLKRFTSLGENGLAYLIKKIEQETVKIQTATRDY